MEIQATPNVDFLALGAIQVSKERSMLASRNLSAPDMMLM